MNCAQHSDRPGVGICISCSRVVCVACSTRLQGRNFCRTCLEARAEARPPEPGPSSGPWLRLGVAALAMASAAALVAGFVGLGFLLYLGG